MRRPKLQQHFANERNAVLAEAAEVCLKYGPKKVEGARDEWIAGYRAAMEENAALIHGLMHVVMD